MSRRVARAPVPRAPVTASPLLQRSAGPRGACVTWRRVAPAPAQPARETILRPPRRPVARRWTSVTSPRVVRAPVRSAPKMGSYRLRQHAVSRQTRAIRQSRAPGPARRARPTISVTRQPVSLPRQSRRSVNGACSDSSVCWWGWRSSPFGNGRGSVAQAVKLRPTALSGSGPEEYQGPGG